MHPDKAAHDQEAIQNALREAAELESRITFSDNLASVRFRFAEEVALRWLGEPETWPHLFQTLRESVMALVQFAQRAARTYLDSRPAGTFGLDVGSNVT